MEMVMSYETLFELLRTERSRTELQQLPASYAEDLQKLLKQEQQHEKNILKITHEIYERREKKIITMAIDKSKTKSALIDFTKFLDYERELFDLVLKLLDRHRDMHTLSLEAGKKDEPKEEFQTADSVEKPKIENNLKTVRFLSPLPKFVGPELEQYGPFDEEDVASLPSKIVQVLVDKKRAEEIQPM
ncbi:hypothetical protein GOV09_01650 [Candidatus Woesearchaeota archaeon]|nr:hypothetical protein [Candidatus Woesearchaeota archaeon]